MNYNKIYEKLENFKDSMPKGEYTSGIAQSIALIKGLEVFDMKYKDEYIYSELPFKLSNSESEAFAIVTSKIEGEDIIWSCEYKDTKGIIQESFSDKCIQRLFRKVNESVSEDFYPYDASYYFDKTNYYDKR